MSDDVLPESLETAFNLMRKHGAQSGIECQPDAAAPLRALGILSARDQMRQQTHNLSPEEIAERDRPKSRQERRQLERLREKGRA